MNNICYLKFMLLPNGNVPQQVITSLGQFSINIILAKRLITKMLLNIKWSIVIRLHISIIDNKIINISVKNPPVSIIFKKILKIESFLNYKGIITNNILNKVLLLKFKDFNTFSIPSCIKMIKGSIKSYGIKYEKI